MSKTKKYRIRRRLNADQRAMDLTAEKLDIIARLNVWDRRKLAEAILAGISWGDIDFRDSPADLAAAIDRRINRRKWYRLWLK
ncbi:MAG: hypothetical protein JEZ07_19805 [Phycisphaerae bacterium]|nr:hypothetical protein [Phycisphaerae bacterium]